MMKLNTEMSGFNKDASTISLKNTNRVLSGRAPLAQYQDQSEKVIVDNRRFIA